MKKIPTLFERTEDRKHVINQVTAGCEWVLAGEGTATRKFDGTCVRITHDRIGQGSMLALWTRREVKPGKPDPDGFRLEEEDPITGKRFGWLPYSFSDLLPLIDEATGRLDEPSDWPEGTYELCGPKINGNPEGFTHHVLVRHGSAIVDAPRDFESLREYLTMLDNLIASKFEGIVWHHPDGRMAKLKRRDFPA